MSNTPNSNTYAQITGQSGQKEKVYPAQQQQESQYPTCPHRQKILLEQQKQQQMQQPQM